MTLMHLGVIKPSYLDRATISATLLRDDVTYFPAM